MASIKLKGDTSGEITIDVPAVAGTNTITLPAATGNVLTDGAALPAIDGSALTNLPKEIKAWVNYNQVGDTVNSSYNVSSVTDNSTGNFTVNFTSSFSDTNYLALSGAGYVNNNRGGSFTGQDGVNNDLTKTTSACQFKSCIASSANSNANNPYDLYINNIIFME